MIALYHKRRTVHSIFQIHISQNTKCAHKTGFPGSVIYCDIKSLREFACLHQQWIQGPGTRGPRFTEWTEEQKHNDYMICAYVGLS